MSLFNELKRRNVIRVAMAYVVAAWLIIQVVETIFPAFGASDTAIRLIVVMLAIAFIPTLVFSWVFEITPEGLKKEVEVSREQSITRFTGKQLDRVFMLLLALALAYFAFDKFVLEPNRDAELAKEITQNARSEALAESYGDKSIAVLPFVNMSAEPEQEYFSDGISEELLNLLAKVPELRVISRSSAFSFKGKDIGIPEVAEQLNVAHVLEGSVRKAGNRLRISAQLIEARSDTHLWSETYDRDLTARNLFAIQSEIAESISHALNSILTSGDRDRLSMAPTDNLDAFYAYHLGRQRMINRTTDSLEGAADLFQQAIELDPDYALAYVGLADTYMLLGDYGNLAAEEMAGLAEPALIRALELDDRLAPAYASLGAVRSKIFDFAGALKAHRLAIDLDPDYATALHWYSDLLVNFAGRPEEAVPLLERALNLDPLSPSITVTLGQAYEGLGQFEAAMNRYLRAKNSAPDYPGSYLLIAQLYHFAHGRLDEAARWRLEGLSRNPGQVSALSAQGLLYLDLGDDERAEKWINKAYQLSPGHIASNWGLAHLYRYRGQRTEALESARRLLEIAPGNNASLASLVRFGRYREAMQSFAVSNPELFCDGDPTVTRPTIFQALNLSLALEHSGDQECAELLLESVLEQIQTMPRLGSWGFGIADVEVYARQGKTDLALSVLRQAIDDHWRAFWWSQGTMSPHLDSLRDEPEFIAMMSEIEADMAGQLKRIKARKEELEDPVL